MIASLTLKNTESGKMKSGLVAGATNHRSHDGDQFGQFLLELHGERRINTALFAQELKP